MDERKANIDLVFRNGLKDFEVLPPPEVWNNIRPVVRKKQRPLIILRTAAAVAVILSLSFLAYQFSRQISGSIENNTLTLNEESGSQVITFPQNSIPAQLDRNNASDASSTNNNTFIP